MNVKNRSQLNKTHPSAAAVGAAAGRCLSSSIKKAAQRVASLSPSSRCHVPVECVFIYGGGGWTASK